MKTDFSNDAVEKTLPLYVNRISSDPMKVAYDLTTVLPNLADQIKEVITLCGDRTLVDLTLQWDKTIDDTTGRILATLYSIDTP